ncbi:transcriptional regulator [Streptomyces cinnamoneus]|uniref:Transcriptional regulator n=1 Tax=Streptomyces cinnamoneus TaxID=53446 RepID=A0A2G1XGU0_STRCJ|nr:DUF5937 family protein [Streptomyces cinnamoneus]PHQ50446.1 transcriptional regulator [Streptomyces cinnamoneus]PPT14302.1 transcriptional regulator [Streptomyces cinnamoneus]
MSVTIDIAGLPPERLVFRPSPLLELCTALHALAEPGHHPGLHGWTTATSSALKPELADRLCEADFLWTSTFSDIALPFAALPDTQGQPGATLAEDLDMLDRLSDELFVDAAMEISCTSRYGSGAPSPLVDAEAREQALERATARGPRPLSFAKRLLDDPPAVRAWMRRLFEDCAEAFFHDIWQRVRVQLAADARHKTEVLRHKGLAEALAEVSSAVTLADDGSRIHVDKLGSGRTTALDPAVGPGVTFVPSSFGWPHLWVLHARSWRPVVHYPVAAPELPGPRSLDLLTLRLEALSHPMRIRMCRYLARASYTTGELAAAHDISAPEVSRHIAVMKKAGLVTTRRRGRYVMHQLDVTVVARLGSDFLEGVLR